jgi:hypothetical protein
MALVFISYAHNDQDPVDWLDKLREQLASYERRSRLEVWDDRRIKARREWLTEVGQILGKARVAVLLVGPNFLASEFIAKHQLAPLLRAAKERGLYVFPLVVRYCAFAQSDLASFQSFNLPDQPLEALKPDEQSRILCDLTIAITNALSRQYAIPILLPEEEQERLLPKESSIGKAGGSSGTYNPDSTDLNSDDLIVENPYNFSAPAKKFFRGRELELGRLIGVLREGKSAVIFGLQRIGKTSLINKVLDEEIKKHSFKRQIITLKIDMFSAWTSFNNDMDFMSTILDELAVHQGRDPEKIKKATREFLMSSSSEFERKKKFREVLERGAKQTNASLVIFIDEFHDIQKVFERARNRKMPNPVDSNLIRWIGSLVKGNTIQLLLCCRHKAIPMERQEKLELFKLLDTINLGMLDDNSAQSLIRDPVDRTVRYEAQSIRRILELTGGHPYLIQYLCSELILAPRVKRSRIVRTRDVEECAEEITSDPTREAKFHILYEDFQEIERGQPWKVLLSLAEHAKSGELVGRDAIVTACHEYWGITFAERSIYNALDILALSQVVGEEKRGRTPSYFIRPDMLRLWLKNRKYIDKIN